MAGGDINETTVFLALGVYMLPKLIDMGLGFTKWSAKRNVEKADKEEEKKENELEKVKDDMQRLDREVLKLTSAHESHKEMVSTALGGIDGRLVQLDARVAEAGKINAERIDEGFKRLEIELNRRLAQLVSELTRRKGRR